MDRELADLIAQYANEARISVSAEIPGYLSIQNISRMFHFTSIHNLESIVTNGFLGRDSLREMNLDFIFQQLPFHPFDINDAYCF